MISVGQIRRAFLDNNILYSKHAKTEMMNEGFGVITDAEIEESIENGEIIEEYLDDKPYPSFLVFGLTSKNRPIHIVSAFDSENEFAIIVTVYEPDPTLWINYKIRRKK